MRELLVATGNRGKLREIELLLHGTVGRILSPMDVPALPDVAEDGKIFAENALKKARSAAMATGRPVVADDSGLVVDELCGHPGVRSARYAGEGAGDAENNAKLLHELAGVPAQRRTAAFHCVIALCMPDGECLTFDGELKGVILTGPQGNGGFGYDPLFLVPEYGQTLAELPLEVKNAISHRGKAFAKLKAHLQRA
ncbi:MAG TPA: XTP/dITP diphosphatase [Geobacteraceae bacterium]